MCTEFLSLLYAEIFFRLSGDNDNDEDDVDDNNNDGNDDVDD